MNIFKKMYYRMYQKTLKFASNFLNFHSPILISGNDSIKKVPSILNELKFKNLLIVTDIFLSTTPIFAKFIKDLKQSFNIQIYDKVVPNPTIDNIEEGLDIYLKNNCQCIIAYGGGSPMDCAKIIAARVTNIKTSVEKMRGILKIKNKPTFLIAIPTTAGTGSEVTVAAVITNAKTHEKYAINDPKLIPHYAILDPSILVSLPSNITSTTGMDALTHAIEAFIGKSNTKSTRKYAKEAVKLIFDSLYMSYLNPNDLKLRQDMQIASYKAGLAFTRAYVGYVHAIAHSLGALYNIPHGLANAIILPYVLKKYGKSIYIPLAELYDYASLGLTDISNKEKAEITINKIEELNNKMNIPTKIIQINECDLEFLINHAIKEANPLYPVPQIWDKNDFLEIYRQLMN